MPPNPKKTRRTKANQTPKPPPPSRKPAAPANGFRWPTLRAWPACPLPRCPARSAAAPSFRKRTRQRITDLARSLNYRVNVSAANLRKRDVQTVGVVILGDSMQAISDPFLLSILGTVADSLDEHGMSLLLTRLKEGQTHRLSEMVESGQVNGLIVIGQLTWHDHLNKLAVRGIPMAVWGACLPDALYPMVGGDNEQGGYLATRHLIQQGCRRIAYFGDITHPEAGARHQGYLARPARSWPPGRPPTAAVVSVR